MVLNGKFQSGGMIKKASDDDSDEEEEDDDDDYGDDEEADDEKDTIDFGDIGALLKSRNIEYETQENIERSATRFLQQLRLQKLFGKKQCQRAVIVLDRRDNNAKQEEDPKDQ